MSVQTIIKNTVNLDEPIQKQILRDVLGGSDNQAHRFEVELTRDGQTVSLSGAQVYGYFIRPGDITVKLTGGVSGNTAYVVLNEHCYVTPGRFTFSMKVQMGEVLHTVLLYEGRVAVTQGEGVVDDGIVIPSLTAWMQSMRKPNLLDNSDFRYPVRQREGRAGANLTAGYVLDRWRTWADGATVYFNAGKYMGVENQPLYQYLPEPYDRGVVTFAAQTYNGAIDTCTLDTSAVGYSKCAFGSITREQYGLSVTLAENNAYVWAALYEGAYTAETLPAYMPKGYGAELAECQRYYVPIKGARFIYSISNGNSHYFVGTYCFPTTMRTTPNIVASSSAVANFGEVTPGVYLSNETGLFQIYAELDYTPAAGTWMSYYGYATADL